MSYRVVQVIPLEEMSGEDWKLLDYTFLRNKAKNRIAEKVGPNFYGFVKVNIFQKATAKNNYLWPVQNDEVEEILATEEYADFENVGDEELTEDASRVDGAIDSLSGLIAFFGIYAVIPAINLYLTYPPPNSLPPEYTELPVNEEFYTWNSENQAEHIVLILLKIFNLLWLEKMIEDVENSLEEDDDQDLTALPELM